jgi:hypothetical protein
MTFFRSLDRAMQVQAQVSADDTEWFYRIVQTASDRPTWVIEIRDQDGTLIGAL